MSQVVVHCPNCQTKVGVGDEFIGQRIRCGACNAFFSVATSGSAQEGPASYAPQNSQSPNFSAPPFAPPTKTASTAPNIVQTDTAGFSSAPQEFLPNVGTQCPYCRSSAGVYATEKISTAGWVVFAIMLALCWPLFFIGLLMKETEYRCRHCAAKIDRY